MADSTPKDEPRSEESRPLHTPDPTLLDSSFTEGFQADSSDLKPRASEQVLLEFDPLADREEAAAREGLGKVRGASTTSKNSQPDAAQQPSTPSSSVFPSFTALARSLALPIRSKSRSRPGSMDVARGVPSPSTLSAFVEQQTQQPQNRESITQAPSSAGETSTSGRSTPGTSTSEASRGDPPFDFQKFLDQMKSRNAEIVAKYLKSFLSNFAKRTFTVSDQVKIINDFLNFIVKPMRESDIWKNASDAEFDNALEGMEKLVMNQLYQFTFTPAVAVAVPRRQITADDLERDRVLSQRIALFGWITEAHLDIPVGEGSNGFLMFAQQELLKVNHYKAPRDKLICILNCCKVIFGLIRHLKKEEGGGFANPEHLLSNVENPAKLQSEAGYYLSSLASHLGALLMGAVSFIETMDHTSLSNITQPEFERNVEEALQSLPPDSPVVPHAVPVVPTTPITPTTPQRPVSSSSSHEGEESAEPLAITTPVQTLTEDARRLFQKTGDTISKPLNALGRIFNEALDSAEGKMQYLPGPFAPFELGRENRAQAQQQGQGPPPNVPHWSHPDAARQQGQPNYYFNNAEGIPQTPAGEAGVPASNTDAVQAARTPPGTPGYHQGPPDETPSRIPPGVALTPPRLQSLGVGTGVSRTPTPNLDLAGIQAQIDSAHNHAAQAAQETLLQIFPGVEPEIVQWVLDASEGDLGKSIETVLEMSSGE
ncbi:vacuolar protein sorting-associated protein 9a [Favolaschia claudopus]|uniref:Vacuolar protein sorting-associated protein 9a n=1 Tax=Favolaschia claudopus TaxID=2862362 RepID=A0AAW0BFX2_9AGAR